MPAHVGDRSGRSSIVGMPTDPAVRDASGDVVLCGRHRWRGLVGVQTMREMPAATSHAGVCQRMSIGKLIGKPAVLLAWSLSWHGSILLGHPQIFDRTRALRSFVEIEGAHLPATAIRRDTLPDAGLVPARPSRARLERRRVS